MKEEILQTALKYFLKHGIREMSIQKLIAPLGISTKTVYKYFKNKEELLEEVLRLHYAQQYQQLENISADQNPIQLLFDIWYIATQVAHKANAIFFEDLHYYYPELECKIETAIADKFSKQFIQIIQRGIKEGVFRQDIHPEVVLESIYVLYIGIARSSQFKKYKVSSYELLLDTIIAFIRGLGTAKGIHDLDEHIKSFKPADITNVLKEKAVSGLS